ncbi:MAG: TfoX/Sxy family protein [Candidatus Saccharibacteria bacterium]|nr:TfoX/Sxy family protein [Candidatus Saccharibacteria bacterium]
MASSKEFRDYILGQLSGVPGVSCRSMMGEFLLYADGVLFGGIYDDRLLLKKVVGVNDGFGMSEVLPYEGAKTPMYLVDEVDDAEKLGKIVTATVEGIVQARKE